MSQSEDRVSVMNILDKFCGNKMWYEIDWKFDDLIDAKILNQDKKLVGIAKIFRKAGNFGNNPIVEIPKDETEFVYELGLLTHKKPAIIVKFRNKIAYVRLEKIDYEVNTSGKKPMLKIPIGEFKVL
jgi:hypothetical protein